MFNLSTQDVVLSIENTPLVNMNGLVYQEYDNFFGKDIEINFDKADSFVKLKNQTHLNRLKLSDTDLNLKKLKILFMNSKITNALNKKFNTELKFDSLDVWIDGKGYVLKPHVDDKRVKLHLQIYLNDNSVGTSLYNEGKKIYTFDFKKNKGYALLNNKDSVHGVEPVENDGRMSLYVRYA